MPSFVYKSLVIAAERYLVARNIHIIRLVLKPTSAEEVGVIQFMPVCLVHVSASSFQSRYPSCWPQWVPATTLPQHFRAQVHYRTREKWKRESISMLEEVGVCVFAFASACCFVGNSWNDLAASQPMLLQFCWAGNISIHRHLSRDQSIRAEPWTYGCVWWLPGFRWGRVL